MHHDEFQCHLSDKDTVHLAVVPSVYEYIQFSCGILKRLSIWANSKLINVITSLANMFYTAYDFNMCLYIFEKIFVVHRFDG